MMGTISVVIPVRNAEDTLTSCLAALAQLNPLPMEIVLVDNQSTDRSLSMLQEFSAQFLGCPVCVVTEEKRGATTARNCGIRVSQGEVIVFTDADCIVDSAWLSYVTSPFSDPSVGAVAGRVLPGPANSCVEEFSALYTLRLPDRPALHHQWSPLAGGYPTANLAVRRDVLVALGGFIEDVEIYGEDYDLCARIYENGKIIIYSPEAAVVHLPRKTVMGMLRQAFGFGRSHPFLLRRHPTGSLCLELPGKTVTITPWLFTAWLDLASADKKVLVLAVGGWLYQPLFILLIAYALWLLFSTRRYAVGLGMPVSGAKVLVYSCLLIGKSLAMTIGRWWGSFKYGAVCL